MFVASSVSSKPSLEFQSLLEGLLAKDVSQRMSLSQLVVHPFWRGALQHLAQESEISADVRESLRRSVANFTGTVTADSRPTTAVIRSVSANDHTDAAAGPVADDARPGEVDHCYCTVVVVF